ncbi:hypothetical protein VST63_20660 [Mycolicibacterium sp. 050232]|uniref:hypothetical protein n=1 Tax=Mycolicibacterium sp. 050232 TaxID=3113982 RepID=UPI002E27D895|nr:hypothetical protein [Mycolicibacterium sp. 050232]MED5814779.1 hypothetical protein [Mycolicibacterium sp. 050232]
MGERRVSRWLSSNPAVRLGAPVAAVALGISGLFGGLAPQPLADRVDSVQPDAEVTVEPFKLRIKQAVVVDEIADVVKARTPGSHLMVVRLEAANVSSESLGSQLLMPVSRARSYLSRNLVVLDDRLVPTAASVYDADSDVQVSLLSPGLTYRLAVVWEFGGPVPQRLPLGLSELTLRGDVISAEDLRWQDPKEAATLTLPVRDATGEPA